MTDREAIVGALSRFAELPARYFVAISLVSGVLLALTQPDWAARFGLAGFPPWTRLALTAVALLSAAVGGLKVFSAREQARDVAQRRSVAATASEQRKRDAFDALSPRERSLLAFYVLRGTQTFFAPYNHAVAQSLVGQGLLRIGQRGNVLAYPFTIDSVAWTHLLRLLESGAVPPEVIERLSTMTEDQLLRDIDPVRLW